MYLTICQPFTLEPKNIDPRQQLMVKIQIIVLQLQITRVGKTLKSTQNDI